MSTSSLPARAESRQKKSKSWRPTGRSPRGQRRGVGHSLLAHGEPIIWLHGFGLILCLCMIIGLLLLVIYQGIGTFWPAQVVQVTTVDERIVTGEVTRRQRHDLTYAGFEGLSGNRQTMAGRLLHPVLHSRIELYLENGALLPRLQRMQDDLARMAVSQVQMAPRVREAPARIRLELVDRITDDIADSYQRWTEHLTQQLQSVSADTSGQALYEHWYQAKAAHESWLSAPSIAEIQQRWANDAELVLHVLTDHFFALISIELSVPTTRRLIRTGNFEFTGEHFTWVSDYEIVPDSEHKPQWAVVFERLMGGRFYAAPDALLIDGQPVASGPAPTWEAFSRLHGEIRQRWQQRRRLETNDTGAINAGLESIRLNLRRVELRHGTESEIYHQTLRQAETQRQQYEARFNDIREQIRALDQENARYQLQVVTADGHRTELAVADIVRAYTANQLDVFQRLGVYFARWGEFLSAEPREANSEGGVFPAIWGTVTMTLLMSFAVVPFGVLAALYLREYAKAGPVVSIVRVAVNNLAGVPSIVFGVFGLGFFCYIIGASIDQLLFEPKLPTPTFGTGGLLWASLTLALLTLPVVIVATEEALAAVPRSMREGSLACGATKWQTIRRIVLPRAMPGIMTGMILAMARGAGEVAPLMLVGAVKLARELPIDATFPFVHLNRSFMHLGFHIYDLGFQSQNSEAAMPMVFTTTLLLISLIALMNLAAVWLRTRLRKRFEYSQF